MSVSTAVGASDAGAASSGRRVLRAARCLRARNRGNRKDDDRGAHWLGVARLASWSRSKVASASSASALRFCFL